MAARGIQINISEQEKQMMEESIWFSEFLRYMGIVTRPEQDRGTHIWSVKIFCPKGLDVKIWAKMNIERLASFGKRARII